MRHCVSSHLFEDEYKALVSVASKNNVAVALLVRSIIVDAMCEEGFYFTERNLPQGRPRHVQQHKPKAHPRAGEAGEVEGQEPSGDYDLYHVYRTKPGMDA